MIEYDEIACLYQENLEHSKILSILSENLSFKISDYSMIYKKSKEESISLLSKCTFLQLSDDKEIASYPDPFTVFITNSLEQRTIEQLKKEFSFERIYERKDKKNILYLSKANDNNKLLEKLNSLNIKVEQCTKANIISAIIYSKESLNLKPKHKNSDTGSGNQSWRKYSGHSKNSFDNSYKGSYNKKYKRERFNSDGASKWNNSYYNYNSRPQVEEIEIDISKIKYSLHIKYKYPLDSIQKLYQEMKEKKLLDIKPAFIKNEEIVSDTIKTIVAFNSIETHKSDTTTEDPKKLTSSNQTQINEGLNLKIPKTNPLSAMSKNFNKFDMVPQNQGINSGFK